MADNNSEILALLAEQMRAADRDREANMQRFERLTQVMVDGFGRLENKIDGTNTRLDHLTERVDHLTERIDHLTVEVAELKTDMRQVKTDISEINNRLGATFNQTGALTEQITDSNVRLMQVEESQQPTNAELDVRLKVVEQQLRNVS